MELLHGRPFNTLQKAAGAIDATAKVAGYGFAIQDKRPSATTPTRVILRCSKGQPFRSQTKCVTHDSRRRKASTQMRDERLFLSPSQSHGPSCDATATTPISTTTRRSTNATASSRCRKFIVTGKKDEIIALYNSGVRPTHILNAIRAKGGPGVDAISRNDIFNTLRRHRRDELWRAHRNAMAPRSL